MMEQLHSRKNPKRLLHCIYRKADLQRQEKRGVEISPEPMALQVRTIKAGQGDQFLAHKHPLQHRTTERTQESLIIIEGAVKATYYDLDDTVLFETILNPGDCTVTFEGGHKFEILQPTLMYEHKNGPYNGYDKEMIED